MLILTVVNIPFCTSGGVCAKPKEVCVLRGSRSLLCVIEICFAKLSLVFCVFRRKKISEFGSHDKF